MGIYGSCHRVTPTQLERLLRCRSLSEFQAVLNQCYRDHPAYTWYVRDGWGLTGILNEGRAADQPPILDIQHGGTPIPNSHLGYGPHRYFTPEEVRQLVDDLESIGWRNPFRPRSPGVIHPDFYVPGPEDDEATGEDFPFTYEDLNQPDRPARWVHDTYEASWLVYLIQQAAQAGDAIILSID